MLEEIDHNVVIAPYAGPGGWNDPGIQLIFELSLRALDILTVGMGAQTFAQYRSHFSLWCILAAPLILGNDIRSMDNDTLSILSSKLLIAVNQDPLGIQGSTAFSENNTEVWAKPLVGDDMAVALFNRGNSVAMNVTVKWWYIWGDLLNQWEPALPSKAKVTDLWANKYLGVFENEFTAEVDPQDTVVVKITKPYN